LKIVIFNSYVKLPEGTMVFTPKLVGDSTVNSPIYSAMIQFWNSTVDISIGKMNENDEKL